MPKRQRNCDEGQQSNLLKRAKQLPKILSGTFFRTEGWDGKQLNVQAECIQCKRVIKGQYTSTGNFYKHYK